MIVSARIHPGIGIARIGDSADEFVIGPEVIGAPVTGMRDAGEALKRQAARFRVYGIDENGDGKYDALEVETRNFKGPRTYENSGIRLHEDNESVIKERFFLDKANPDILHDEITLFDDAYTRPWTVTKSYRRERNAVWLPNECGEDNRHVTIGKEDYMISPDGLLMPVKKDQPPPDLRYFRQSKK